MDADTPGTEAPEEEEAPRRPSRRMLERHAYRVLALAVLVLLAISVPVYMALEEWGFIDALYFCVVAGTTVGFGDLSPTSDESKLYTTFYVFASVSLFATFLNLRLKYRAERKYQRRHASDRGGSAGSEDPGGDTSERGGGNPS